MRRRGRGTVIFIGSIRSEAPSPFSSIYSASKAAIRSFVECLRLELLGTGVRASVVVPWYVRHGLPQERLGPQKSDYSEAMTAVKARRDGMIAKAADPRVVADAVLALVARADPAPLVVVGRPILSFFIRHASRSLVGRVSARWTGMQPVQKRRTP